MSDLRPSICQWPKAFRFSPRRLASRSRTRWVAAFCLVLVGSAACSKAPATKEEVLARANEDFTAEQYVKAEKEYRVALRMAPEDPVALSRLGIIYHEQGQIPQAYPLLKKAAELQPDNLQVQLKLGSIFVAFGEYQQARDAAREVLDKEPGDEQGLLLLASSAVTPDDLQETRKAVESFRRQDQDRAAYHLALGLLNGRQGDQTGAENEYKAAIELDHKSG